MSGGASVTRAQFASVQTELLSFRLVHDSIHAVRHQAVVEATEKNGTISIIGGGDSVTALNNAGLGDRVTFMSTGGGASLEFLEGTVLPGLAALADK